MIHAYIGENDAERLRSVRRLVTNFTAEHGDMAVEKLDGAEVSYGRIIEAAESIPFLSTRKLLVLRGGSMNKDFTDNFEEFCTQKIASSTDVLLIESKLDKRTTYYKQLQKLTELTVFKELDARQLAKWATEYVSQQGGKLSLTDSIYLIDRLGDAAHVEKRTGMNQKQLENELNKLMLYDLKISRQSINNLTDENPASRIFDLLDAAFNARHEEALRLYENQRNQGIEPQQIIAMLAWQLYNFALVKAGQGMDATELASRTKLKPFVIDKARATLRSMSFNSLKTYVSELKDIDVRSKTESLNLDDALRRYLLTLN